MGALGTNQAAMNLNMTTMCCKQRDNVRNAISLSVCENMVSLKITLPDFVIAQITVLTF